MSTNDPDPFRSALVSAAQRDQVRTARRRRQRRAGTLSALTVVGAAAVALVPSSGPGVDLVVERALATTDAPGKIVEARLRSDWRVGDRRGFTEQTTWVRFSPSGSAITVRALTHDTRGSGESAGDETVSSTAEGLRRYDASADRTIADAQTFMIPGDVFLAREALADARAGKGRARIVDEHAKVDGHDTYRIAIEDETGPGGVREVYVDRASYEPVMTTRTSTDADGVEDVFRERVDAYRELDDTAANRRLLELRGPTRP